MSDPKEKHVLRHDRLKVRQEIAKNETFIVAPIFPSGSLHLVVGNSGDGKSTWMFEMFYDWEQGKAVLGGLPSIPCEWVYISLDRSLADTNRTLRRIGLGHWNIPAYCVEELCSRDEQGLLIPPTINRLHALFPGVKLFVIEGLQGLMPNTGRGQSQNKAETLWIINTRDTMLNHGITIIATEHIPKGLDQGALRTKRNTALGSAALIGGAGTIVSFDVPESAKQDKTAQYTDDRMVHISGHNFAPYTLEYSRDEVGRFILQSTRSGAETVAHETDDSVMLMIDTQLSAHAFDREITAALVDSWARVSGMTQSAKYKWMKQQTENGRITQAGKGKYMKVRQQ